MIERLGLSLFFVFLCIQQSVCSVYGQQEGDDQFDNEELLAFAMTHIIHAMDSLIEGNSTDFDMHISVADAQINEVLASKSDSR